MGRDGWSFAADFPGATGDRTLGKRLLREVYVAADPDASGHVTVPVLWDKQRATIVFNESAEIIRMFNSTFDALTGNSAGYWPKALLPEIEAVNDGLNNGVYRAGFANSQAAYDEAVAEVFVTLDWLEVRLGRASWLVGDRPTEADWRLATTLFRFDAVYHGHFKCNLRRLVDYPNLWDYARKFYQHPGVAPTARLDHITTHYYTSHDSLNPSRIVPVGPDLDWTAPHGRARRSAA